MCIDRIPVVFATDDNYALYCYVAIYSLIAHADSRKDYEIYVFETNVTEENKEILKSLSRKNVTVSCIDINECLEGIHLKRSLHLTVETYYRLFIPTILTQYERVLYIDTDMIINADVSDIFNCDLNGKPVGAVADVPTEYMKEHAQEIGDLSVGSYFNAGLLLMDTALFEKLEVRDRCIKLLNEDYKKEKRSLLFADQDALNIVLNENVEWLDGRWNYQVQYYDHPEVIRYDHRETYLSGIEKAFIYHYSGAVKPWSSPGSVKADAFWDIAKQTPRFIDILDHVLGTDQNRKKAESFARWRFPYESISPGSRIVIYAAGKIGSAFYEQIKQTKYAEVVLWTDRDPEKTENDIIKPVENIKDAEFDHVLIAVKKESIAKEIAGELTRLGVDKEKIIWQDYSK